MEDVSIIKGRWCIEKLTMKLIMRIYSDDDDGDGIYLKIMFAFFELH